MNAESAERHEPLSRLRDISPTRVPSEDDPRIDGQAPSLILEPEDTEALGRVLSICDESGLAVVPIGGATRLALGNTPTSLDVYLSTSRLAGRSANTDIEYEPGDLTVSCSAGKSLASLQEVLAEHNQFLPVEPPLPDRASLGGVFAMGEPGFRRRPGGRPRDLLLGFEARLANGDAVKAGGRVVKNVAGYELTKLMVGSSGTLAVLTRLSLRVRARPEAERTLATSFVGTDELRQAVSFLTSQSVLAEAVAIVSPELTREMGVMQTSNPCLLARFEGLSEEVEAGLSGLKHAWRSSDPIELDAEMSERHWGALRDFPLSSIPAEAASVRWQSRPADTVSLASALDAAGASRWLAVPDGGCVYAQSPRASDARDWIEKQAVREYARSWVFERAPLELKRGMDVFGPEPSSLDLMRSIKMTFDPNGILSPGRYLGRL